MDCKSALQMFHNTGEAVSILYVRQSVYSTTVHCILWLFWVVFGLSVKDIFFLFFSQFHKK